MQLGISLKGVQLMRIGRTTKRHTVLSRIPLGKPEGMISGVGLPKHTVPEAAQLTKPLTGKNKSKTTMAQLQDSQGNASANAKDILEILAKSHFPESTPHLKDAVLSELNQWVDEHRTWLSKEMFQEAVNKFASYKAPGMDGIKPLILKNLDDSLIGAILSIYNAIIELGYTPTT